MNSLSRNNPLRELEDFQNRVLSAFSPSSRRGGDGNSEWMPLVDISEDEKEYVFTTELPEVKKEDVKVTVENGVLLITGERKIEKEDTQKKYHRIERSYGTFARSFLLPDDGDPGKISAQFKDGLLKVHIAKSETSKPKQIEVKVS